MSAFSIKIGRFAILKKGKKDVKGADGYWKQWGRLAWYVKEVKKCPK